MSTLVTFYIFICSNSSQKRIYLTFLQKPVSRTRSKELTLLQKPSVEHHELEAEKTKKNKDNYVFEKQFLNNDFKAIITIDNKGIISGKVIDLQVDEEYTNIRTEMTGEFVNKVRESYRFVLEDIRKKCCETNYFISNQSNRINKYIKEKGV